MVGVVVDAPVIMQLDLQQSVLFILLKVPQSQFMISAQCKTAQNTVEISQVQVRWWTFL